MGWDAYCVPRETEWYQPEKGSRHTKLRLVDEVLREAFKEADRAVFEKTDSCDGLLLTGGLDCSDCATMLENATGMDCYCEDGYSAKEVNEIWEKDDLAWKILFGKGNEVPPEKEWAYWSAYYFLKTCAEKGLGIEFSW